MLSVARNLIVIYLSAVWLACGSDATAPTPANSPTDAAAATLDSPNVEGASADAPSLDVPSADLGAGLDATNDQPGANGALDAKADDGALPIDSAAPGDAACPACVRPTPQSPDYIPTQLCGPPFGPRFSSPWAFSEASDLMVSETATGYLRAVRASDGKELWFKNTQSPSVASSPLSVVVSPNGRYLATAGSWTSPPVVLWSLPDLTVKATYKDAAQPKFSPDGLVLAMRMRTADSPIYGKVQFYDPATGETKGSVSVEDYPDFAISPDHTLVAIGYSGARLDSEVRTITDDRRVARLPGQAAKAFTFSPDGQKLSAIVPNVAGSTNIVTWRTTDWTVAQTSPAGVWNSIVMAQDRIVAFAGKDAKTATVLDINTGEALGTFAVTSDNCGLLSQGDLLCLGNDVERRALPSGELRSSWHDPYSDSRAWLLGFTPDDGWIFDGSPFAKTCVAVPTTRMTSNSSSTAGSSSTSVSPDGAYFLESKYTAGAGVSLGRTADLVTFGNIDAPATLSPTADRYLSVDKVVVTSTGATLFQKAGYYLRAFSPDGAAVLGIPQDATEQMIAIFDASTGDLLGAITTPVYALSWAFSPDGRYVFSGVGPGIAGTAPGVAVCGVQTRNCTLLADSFPPVAVSSKGILVTATGTAIPHTLQFWTEDGTQLLGRLPLYDYRVPTAEFGELLNVAFSHDGTALQTVYWGGETALWCP